MSPTLATSTIYTKLDPITLDISVLAVSVLAGCPANNRSAI